MKTTRKLTDTILEYLVTKLAALNLLLAVMCLCMILGTGFDLYEFTESLSDLKFWGFICGYALMASMLIDWVNYKWKKFSVKVSILLHGIAGFVAFIPFMGVNVYAVFAGSVGALCAFVYAFSCYFLVRRKRSAWIFLAVIPLLLWIRVIDFTVKEGWSEEKTASSFSAEFERFHGKNDIPISLEKGDLVTAHISFDDRNGGGYGYHVLDETGELVAMEELDKPQESYEISPFQFKAKKAGTYQIVLTGDNLEGKIAVKWEID